MLYEFKKKNNSKIIFSFWRCIKNKIMLKNTNNKKHIKNRKKIKQSKKIDN